MDKNDHLWTYAKTFQWTTCGPRMDQIRAVPQTGASHLVGIQGGVVGNFSYLKKILRRFHGKACLELAKPMKNTGVSHFLF
jgi:hypothetical protein